MVISCQLYILIDEKFSQSCIVQFSLLNLVDDVSLIGVAVLGNTLGQLVNYNSISYRLWQFDLDYTFVYFLLMMKLLLMIQIIFCIASLNAMNRVVNQILVLWNRLLLEPNVKLILYIGHFKLWVTKNALIVSKHTFGFEKSWNAFAPA